MIEPSRAALGFRQCETRGDEVPRGEIEFAQHHRVGAAARQLYDGAIMGTGDRRGPAPRPVLALVGRQRVEVEQDVPLWVLAAVAVERRRPPQAARVYGVFPEI